MSVGQAYRRHGRAAWPQFPIGLADAGGDDGGLLLSWGLRDHESCLTQVGLGTLRGMLRPLE